MFRFNNKDLSYGYLSQGDEFVVHFSHMTKQEQFTRQIIESRTDFFKKVHFFSIIIRNSQEFLDIRPFT